MSVPLVVNGDIRSFDDVAKALTVSGADAVMVGRAAQGRPWFPGRSRATSRLARESAPPLATSSR